MSTQTNQDLLGWIGGAVVIGVVFGLVLALLVEPVAGIGAGAAAALVWFIAGALRRGRSRN